VNWSTVFLGIIAMAMLTTAVVQVFVLISAGRITRRLDRMVTQVERDISPLIASLNAIGQDAARAASLATAQVERVDRLLGEAAQRVEATLGVIQNAISAPAREGAALMIGFRAALEALRRSVANRSSRSRSGDDEDALFI